MALRVWALHCRGENEPADLVPLRSDYFPFKATPHGQFANHSEAMASNLLGISCFVVIARWMYLHKIFINV